jgi:hypothetical protein
MAYNEKYDRTVLFGGALAPPQGGMSNETWTYDYNNNTWVNMNPTSSPSPRFHCAMIYDKKNTKIILFGGHPLTGPIDNETWVYDYKENTWTNMKPTITPPARESHGMSYDEKKDKAILFGGEWLLNMLNDTWSYDVDNNKWTNLTNPIAPAPRQQPCISYDSESQITIMYGGGGLSSNESKIVWKFDWVTNRWMIVGQSVLPFYLYIADVCSYNSGSDRIISFIPWGRDIAETWAYSYNGNTWDNLTSSIQPSPRNSFSMSYDSESNCIILFGGTMNPFDYDDTWAFGSDCRPISHNADSHESNIIINLSFLVVVVIAVILLVLLLIKRRKKLIIAKPKIEN